MIFKVVGSIICGIVALYNYRIWQNPSLIRRGTWQYRIYERSYNTLISSPFFPRKKYRHTFGAVAERYIQDSSKRTLELCPVVAFFILIADF
jgi:hypothetical protein